MCTDPGYLEDACKGDSGGPAVHYDSFRTEFKNILQSVPNQPGKRTSARVNFGTKTSAQTIFGLKIFEIFFEFCKVINSQLLVLR